MIGIEYPVVTLPVLPALGRQLHEALVQRQVVPDRVSPSLVLPVAVVREILCYEIVDPVEGQSPLQRALNGHGDECHVRIRGLHGFQLVVSVVAVHGVELDLPGGNARDGLRIGLVGFAAHRQRVLQRKSYLSLAGVLLHCAVTVCCVRNRHTGKNRCAQG